MSKFRKKPVVIDAVQWNGDMYAMIEFSDGSDNFGFVEDRCIIDTLEGQMTAMPGDWVIKGISGEFYPCKPDIFEKTYEPAD
jgi:hypothetical protein